MSLDLDEEVLSLCERYGYGAVSQEVAAAWRAKEPDTSCRVGPARLFTVPCACLEGAPMEVIGDKHGHCDWCCGCGWLAKRVKLAQVAFLLQAEEVKAAVRNLAESLAGSAPSAPPEAPDTPPVPPAPPADETLAPGVCRNFTDFDTLKNWCRLPLGHPGPCRTDLPATAPCPLCGEDDDNCYCKYDAEPREEE